jgi:hypothetical protein
MHQTIADVPKEDGCKKGRREEAVSAFEETLLLQLKERFRLVPPEVANTIKAAAGIKQLKTWLNRFATPKSLADQGIESAN